MTTDRDLIADLQVRANSNGCERTSTRNPAPRVGSRRVAGQRAGQEVSRHLVGGHDIEVLERPSAASARGSAAPIDARSTSPFHPRHKELSAHAPFTIQTGLPVYFADPHSPWQRGTNENTNGLLRHYFPKGTDLSRWSAEDIAALAATLNSRPHKTLD